MKALRYLTLALVVSGCATQQTLRARQIEIVDAEGRTRMVLRSQLGPEIKLLDETGKPRASLMLFPNGPTFALLDPSGNISASIYLLDIDGASFSVVSVEGPGGKRNLSLMSGPGTYGLSVDGELIPAVPGAQRR